MFFIKTSFRLTAGEQRNLRQIVGDFSIPLRFSRNDGIDNLEFHYRFLDSRNGIHQFGFSDH